MPRTPTSIRRACLTLAAAVGAVLLGAGPAAAHVEVEADTAQALAENVTLTFSAESESDKAGITSLRVVLPEGITPADSRTAQAPRAGRSGRRPTATPSRGPPSPSGRTPSTPCA
ncbi:hypothetical protein ACIOWI_34310 [Streptomyces sp. NPDC087659]|uniref:hypothetical protein n=1 Tax=Streptomyces sp. NPDC087659 TaxID=3365801 RepID=UPI00380A07FF